MTSDKQIAYAVRDGKLVTFSLPLRTVADGIEANATVVGYVFGADDYHWAVVTPDLDEHLVHKSAPLVSIAGDPSLDDEPKVNEIKAMTNPFRNHVLVEFFGHRKTQGA